MWIANLEIGVSLIVFTFGSNVLVSFLVELADVQVLESLAN